MLYALALFQQTDPTRTSIPNWLLVLLFFIAILALVRGIKRPR